MGYNVRENVHGNAGVEGMNFFHLNFFFPQPSSPL